jgi:hypothetical protein
MQQQDKSMGMGMGTGTGTGEAGRTPVAVLQAPAALHASCCSSTHYSPINRIWFPCPSRVHYNTILHAYKRTVSR